MQKEYGSNFCEELQKSGGLLEDSDGRLFFDSGRSALRYLLDFLGARIERVLLPQYDCESVLEPFIERNYRISYYPVDRYFRPCGKELRRLVEKEKPQLILVQAYFGFDTLADERDFLADIRKQGVTVIEDITHSLFLSSLKDCSDYRFASLRKWCAIPDGGILLGPQKHFPSVSPGMRENTEFVTERIEAQRQKREYFARGDGEAPKGFIALYDRSEALLDIQKNYYTMSLYTRERIASLEREKIISSRRSCYDVLKGALSRVPYIEIIYPDLPENAVPLYFPVYISPDKRDRLRLRMREKGIFLPVIWPLPTVLGETVSDGVRDIYNKILAIPCDQRYTGKDMRFIADVIKQEIELC